MTAPNGWAQMESLGNPRDFLMPDGSIDAMRWEGHLGLVTVDFPAPLPLSFAPDKIGQAIRVHPIAVEPFRRAFGLIYSEGRWNDLRDYGGGYTPRTQRGTTSKWSTHAWGLAIDVDVRRNPLGERPVIDLAIVRIFEACGFTWGGGWRRPDGQHFQYASGY